MAKELPYFKFNVAEWLIGDIVYEPFDVQGLFINICAVYWQRNGNLTIEEINKRFKNPQQLTNLNGRYFSLKDGLISIKFLDEQFEERKQLSFINSVNGKKSAASKALKILDNSTTVQRPFDDTSTKLNNIEKKRKEKKKIIPPSLDEFKLYFNQNGFQESVAVRAWNGYNEAGWNDSYGKPVLNWKSKCQNVWFKDENKMQVNKSGTIQGYYAS